MADKKRPPLGRLSFAPTALNKTPNRPRLTLQSHTPAGSRTAPRFSLGGPQNSGKSRLSVYKAPQVAGQPRDTGDKGNQVRMVKKIHAFLVGRDGEDQVPSEASIHRPSSHDFISIFEKIYECLSPNYEFTREKKLTEEVPRIFSELGYPYTIKAATLQTVGAPHSWHYLLHALCWLIDFVQKTESINVGEQILLGGDEGNGHLKAFRASWLTKYFHEYRKNPAALNTPAFLEAAAQDIKDFHENNENIQGQIQASEFNLRSMQAEIEEFKSTKGGEDKIREDIRKTEEDFKKTATYVESLVIQNQQGAADRELVERETQEVKVAVDELKASIQAKKAAVVAQERERGIKADQAVVIMSEYVELKQQLRESRSELEHLSKENWVSQPKANDVFNQLMLRFRKVAGTVKDIASQVDHQLMKMDDSAIRNMKDLQNALVREVRLEMEALRTTMETRMAQMDKEIKTIEMKRNHTQKQCDVEEEKLAEIARRVHRKRLAHQQYTDEAKEERRKENVAIEKLENEKDLLLQRQRGVAALQQELEAARKDLEEAVSRAEAQKAEFEGRLNSSVFGAFEAMEKLKQERESLSTFVADFKENQNVNFVQL